jgi:plastocyanin
MKLRKPATGALAAVVAAGVLVPTVVADGATKKKPKPVKKSVEMKDNYYSPAKLTITAGSTVTWKWPADVGDSHDVKVTKKPSGAKFTYVNDDGKKVTKSTFQSPPFAAGPAKFAVTGFTKPGRYHLICTFHETEMTMDITVKK